MADAQIICANGHESGAAVRTNRRGSNDWRRGMPRPTFAFRAQKAGHRHRHRFVAGGHRGGCTPLGSATRLGVTARQLRQGTPPWPLESPPQSYPATSRRRHQSRRAQHRSPSDAVARAQTSSAILRSPPIIQGAFEPPSPPLLAPSARDFRSPAQSNRAPPPTAPAVPAPHRPRVPRARAHAPCLRPSSQ